MTVRFLLAAVGCSFALVACGSPDSSVGGAADPEAASADEVVAAPDPVMLDNAKAFFRAMIESSTNRDESRIPYAQLPSRLAHTIAHDNPNPNEEWADEAYRTQVKDSQGRDVTVFCVIGGIDDEGESFSVYTTRGREIASGDDYRGFRWV